MALLPPNSPRFVAYIRVSTDKQGRSGLGLEAQTATVQAYAARCGGQIIETFQEVESGKRSDRPELLRALALCRHKKAILIIAKLDRLSRNVAFIANLMESRVEFVACDMPEANKLTLHIMAAMAQHEREATSKRTKEALAAAQARGQKLGSPRPGSQEGSRAWVEQAQQFRSGVYPLARQMRDRGLTLRQIAQELNERHIQTCNQRAWHPATVNRLLKETTPFTGSLARGVVLQGHSPTAKLSRGLVTQSPLPRSHDMATRNQEEQQKNEGQPGAQEQPRSEARSEPRKAIIYAFAGGARPSEETPAPLSLAEQVAQCRAKADAMGLEVVRVFQDGEADALPAAGLRPQRAAALKALEAGEARFFIMAKMSLLASDKEIKPHNNRTPIATQFAATRARLIFCDEAERKEAARLKQENQPVRPGYTRVTVFTSPETLAANEKIANSPGTQVFIMHASPSTDTDAIESRPPSPPNPPEDPI